MIKCRHHIRLNVPLKPRHYWCLNVTAAISLNVILKCPTLKRLSVILNDSSLGLLNVPLSWHYMRQLYVYALCYDMMMLNVHATLKLLEIAHFRVRTARTHIYSSNIDSIHPVECR